MKSIYDKPEFTQFILTREAVDGKACYHLEVNCDSPGCINTESVKDEITTWSEDIKPILDIAEKTANKLDSKLNNIKI